MELVERVFSKFLHEGVDKDDILHMMEEFGLIAKFSPSPNMVKYLVPAQLKKPRDDICAVETSQSDPCPLYIQFVGGFVPHGLFIRLVSQFISWCSTDGQECTPELCHNGAWFVIKWKQSVFHDLVLICKKRFIKMVLREKLQDQQVSGDTSTEVATQMRKVMENALKKLSQDLPYLRGMRYQLCVECPCCERAKKKCEKHKADSCTAEDCLHLLEVKEGKTEFCKETLSHDILTVKGLDKWFSQVHCDI